MSIAAAPRYRETRAKTLLRESVLVDPWFIARFGLNLYRGCEHGCVYCDGRAERYYVEGEFDRDIAVKSNALELAEREFAKQREPGFLFLGGGVSDSYQPAERQFRIARGILEHAVQQRMAVHVLTKSALVERDFDLLSQAQRDSQAILSFSIQTVDDALRANMEPGAASIEKRFTLLARARSLGICGGIMAMPILPGLSDSQAQIHDLVQRASDAGAQFICFGGLTLRPGRQKEGYYELLRAQWQHLLRGYDRAYGRNLASGAPDARYSAKITRRFAEALAKFPLPSRIPRAVFAGRVPSYTEASVLLEHLDAEAHLRGEVSRLWDSGQRLALWAKKRLSARRRGRAGDYSDVEREFADRLRDGSLCEIDGFEPQALHALHFLGFGGP